MKDYIVKAIKMNKYILIILTFVISCNNNKKINIEYYPNGSIKKKYNVVDSIKEGECIEYYENGKIKNIYSYLHNKRVGYEREYDSIGILSKVFQLNLLKTENLLEFWDNEEDSINTDLKDSYINCVWAFDSFGNIDSLNSNYYQIKEIIEDSLKLQVYLSLPYFRNKNDSINYEFYFKTSLTKDTIYRHFSNYPFTTFSIKSDKKNVKVNFIIVEKNMTHKKDISYRGFHYFGKNKNVFFPRDIKILLNQSMNN